MNIFSVLDYAQDNYTLLKYNSLCDTIFSVLDYAQNNYTKIQFAL